jgi:hypothetical protein
MFILFAYVCSDKHSLTFCHYSGMSAPYPKPHPSVSMLLTTVLLMYIYTACWLNNYVVQLCPFWCNSYGARLSRLLTPSSLPLESEPACPCLIAKVCFSWAETAQVMCTRACHCHLLHHQLWCYATMPDSVQLNRRVSQLTLLQQHHPNLTCPKNNLVVLTSRPPPR